MRSRERVSRIVMGRVSRGALIGKRVLRSIFRGFIPPRVVRVLIYTCLQIISSSGHCSYVCVSCLFIYFSFIGLPILGFTRMVRVGDFFSR